MAELQTMYPGQVNSPAAELSEDINATVTTITLVDSSILPSAPNIAVIGVGENAETILYLDKNDVTNELLNVTRGFQGQTKTWTTGIKIRRLFVAYDWDSARKNIEETNEDLENAKGNLSNIQTEFDNFENSKEQANGIASLDENAQVPLTQLENIPNILFDIADVELSVVAPEIIINIPDGIEEVILEMNAITSSSNHIYARFNEDSTTSIYKTNLIKALSSSTFNGVAENSNNARFTNTTDTIHNIVFHLHNIKQGLYAHGSVLKTGNSQNDINYGGISYAKQDKVESITIYTPTGTFAVGSKFKVRGR